MFCRTGVGAGRAPYFDQESSRNQNEPMLLQVRVHVCFVCLLRKGEYLHRKYDEVLTWYCCM